MTETNQFAVDSLKTCLFLSIAEPWTERGFKIIPLRPGTKVPAIKEWPRHATSNTNQLRKWAETWPNANAGVLTGKGLVVIDQDVKGDKDGIAAWDRIKLQNGYAAATYSVETPSGGRHDYYLSKEAIKSSKSALAPGIDICGKGSPCQVVLPGSEVDGKSYRSINCDTPIARRPDFLVEHAGVVNPLCQTIAPTAPLYKQVFDISSLDRGIPIQHKSRIQELRSKPNIAVLNSPVISSEQVADAMRDKDVQILVGEMLFGWNNIADMSPGDYRTVKSPIRPDEHSSGSIWLSTDENLIVFQDRGLNHVMADSAQLDTEWFTLPHLSALGFASRCKDEADSAHQELDPCSYLTWSVRLLYQAGLIDLPELDRRAIVEVTKPRAVEDCYAGLDLLTRIRLKLGNPNEIGYSQSFASRWYHIKRYDEHKRALQWLRARGFIEKVGRQGRMNLWCICP